MMNLVSRIEKVYTTGLKDEVYKKAIQDLEASAAEFRLREKDKANSLFYSSKAGKIKQYAKGIYVDLLAE
jgi:hypothetical protein